MEEIAGLKKIIERGGKFLVVGHKNPDGDALGSATALAGLLRARGNDMKIFFSTPPPACFHYLSGVDMISLDARVLSEPFDAVYVVDSSDLAFCGIKEGTFSVQIPIVVIDHHITNKRFGQINLIKTECSSTSEYLNLLIHELGYGIDKDISTSLLTGVLTDTELLSNQATMSSTFDAVAQLLLNGANIRTILKNVFHGRTLASLKLFGLALSRLKINESLGMASTFINKGDLRELSASEDDLNGIANMLNFVEGVRIAIVLKEAEPGFIKVSLRTSDHLMDVSRIASIFGGGGHKKAAGFTIQGRVVETDQGWLIT